jgi:hypothetical protein
VESEAVARIIFAGYLMRYPLGGYAWQAVHYLLGFRALGHDVWFYEDTGSWGLELAYNPITDTSAPEYDFGLKFTADLLERFGFGDRWVFADLERGVERGPGAGHASELLRESDLLVSFGAVNRAPIEQWKQRPAVFIDADPVYNQIKLLNGDTLLSTFVGAHTHLFTFGENIGTPRSELPTAGYDWRPTRQPVAIECWENSYSPGSSYTTIGTWNQGRDLTYEGKTLQWRKRSEWLRCLDLPARTGANFELAMDVSSVPGDVELLTEYGWHIVNPIAVSADPWRYRDYIRKSRGEYTVAKGMNIYFRSGWFSDRAACYLACGRPVVLGDTGFGDVLPCGPGLSAFHNVAEAADAIRAIERDYDRASANAIDVAREFFAADRVLRSLLAAVGM